VLPKAHPETRLERSPCCFFCSSALALLDWNMLDVSVHFP
jgi:hypothetical protein